MSALLPPRFVVAFPRFRTLVSVSFNDNDDEDTEVRAAESLLDFGRTAVVGECVRPFEPSILSPVLGKRIHSFPIFNGNKTHVINYKFSTSCRTFL